MVELRVIKLFNKLGIRKALTQTRTIFVDKKQLNLVVLVSRWSMETHTFVAS